MSLTNTDLAAWFAHGYLRVLVEMLDAGTCVDVEGQVRTLFAEMDKRIVGPPKLTQAAGS